MKIPTQVGDVLILQTTKSFTIFVVGLITRDGQQDFQDSSSHDNLKTRAAALERAKTLVRTGRHIFLLDIDADFWTELTE